MIGDLIKERRVRQGLSQVELARRVGSTQRQVSRWENGSDAMLPRRDTLDRLGAALGISLPEFYRAAGVLEDPEPDPLDAPPSPHDPLDVMVQRVKNSPDMMRQLRRAEEINDPAVFQAILEAVADAWLANLKMGLRVNDADRTKTGTGTGQG